MGTLTLPAAVLAALLEHIQAPAFVTLGRELVAVNRLGRAWLAAADGALLLRTGGPDRGLFDVTAFDSRGRRHALAVLRGASDITTVGAARDWRLTERESQVMRWMLRGSTNQQIADELGCALKTVEHHVSSVLRKANVENRASLIFAALAVSPS